MIIANGNVFGADGKFRQGNIEIHEEWIHDISFGQEHESETNLKEQEILDAQGWYVIPGLVDIHLHGCAGYDF